MKKLMIVAMLMMFSIISGCIMVVSPAIITFEATPPTITAGQDSYLVWVVTGVQSVNIEPGIGTTVSVGTVKINPAKTTVYTLTASGTGGTISRSVTVTVNPGLAIVNFEAKPSNIIAGGETTLQWNVTGARSVTINPGIGQVEMTGSRKVYPAATTTYTLVAQGDAGTDATSIIVTVASPPVNVSFTVYPEQVTFGDQRAQLRWSVEGANRVRIVPDVGEVPAAGNYGIIPRQTTTYVLTAWTDCCVISRSVTITVVGSLTPPQYGPVVELFNITPNSIYRGESATLQWRVSNAQSVSIDQGIGQVPASGSITVSPLTNTTYTLTVSNLYAFYSVTVKLLVFEK